MTAAVAVVADRPQLPQEFIADIGVGQVVDLRRRPGPAALADATSARHHGTRARLPSRAVDVLVVLTPPVSPFPLLQPNMLLLDLVALSRALGVVAVLQRRVRIGNAAGIGGLAHGATGEAAARLALVPVGDPT